MPPSFALICPSLSLSLSLLACNCVSDFSTGNPNTSELAQVSRSVSSTHSLHKRLPSVGIAFFDSSTLFAGPTFFQKNIRLVRPLDHQLPDQILYFSLGSLSCQYLSEQCGSNSPMHCFFYWVASIGVQQTVSIRQRPVDSVQQTVGPTRSATLSAGRLPNRLAAT